MSERTVVRHVALEAAAAVYRRTLPCFRMVLSLLWRLSVCRSSSHTLRSHGRSYSKASPALSERLRVFESLREAQSKRAEASTEVRLAVRLADGRALQGVAGVTTPLVVAQKARVKGCLVSKVNGVLWDLLRPLEADCELELLGFDTKEGKQTAWRTAACVVGGVLEGAFGAELCREGVSDFGLYCDHLLDTGCGDSLGVCSGPLLPHTGLLKVFKMLQVSPVTLANQPQCSGVMRLMGVAFPGERERAGGSGSRRRRAGGTTAASDQELFFFNDVSPGSCFFLPKGAHIYNTLTDFIKLPLRWADFGALHRTEASGALTGPPGSPGQVLARDDAHIFLHP
ncbi:hypothetical protein CRUP_003321 [Coryphaenoides rupestris]|nr:hypothetical protein CRUP_003321 [Coryphaenoides rupestris]